MIGPADSCIALIHHEHTRKYIYVQQYKLLAVPFQLTHANCRTILVHMLLCPHRHHRQILRMQ